MSRAIVILLMLTSSIEVQADTWSEPYPYTYTSHSGMYRLTVYPAGNYGPSGGSDILKDIAEGKPHVVPPSRAKEWPEAVLDKLEAGRYIQVRTVRLINSRSPESVAVSDLDGRFATFDNWGSRGYGDDVVVIYNSDGRVVRQFSLEDLVGGKRGVESIPRSISSIQWGGRHHIDSKKGLLILQVVSSGRYSVPDPTYREVRVRLVDGAILGKL